MNMTNLNYYGGLIIPVKTGELAHIVKGEYSTTIEDFLDEYTYDDTEHVIRLLSEIDEMYKLLYQLVLENKSLLTDSQFDEDFFCHIRWHKDDVRCALENADISPTEQNIESFVYHGSKTLNDRSIEIGWEVIDDLISIIGIR